MGVHDTSSTLDCHKRALNGGDVKTTASRPQMSQIMIMVPLVKCLLAEWVHDKVNVTCDRRLKGGGPGGVRQYDTRGRTWWGETL